MLLLGPVEREIDIGQTRRGELDRLSALQDRIDKLRVQKGQIDEAPDVAPTDAIALR